MMNISQFIIASGLLLVIGCGAGETGSTETSAKKNDSSSNNSFAGSENNSPSEKDGSPSVGGSASGSADVSVDGSADSSSVDSGHDVSATCKNLPFELSPSTRLEVVISSCEDVGIGKIRDIFPLLSKSKLVNLEDCSISVTQDKCQSDAKLSCKVLGQEIEFSGSLTCSDQKCALMQGELMALLDASECMATVKLISPTKK